MFEKLFIMESNFFSYAKLFTLDIVISSLLCYPINVIEYENYFVRCKI